MQLANRCVLGPYDIDNFLLCTIKSDIKKAEKERHNVLLYKGIRHPKYIELTKRINQLKNTK